MISIAVEDCDIPNHIAWFNKIFLNVKDVLWKLKSWIPIIHIKNFDFQSSCVILQSNYPIQNWYKWVENVLRIRHLWHRFPVRIHSGFHSRVYDWEEFFQKVLSWRHPFLLFPKKILCSERSKSMTSSSLFSNHLQTYSGWFQINVSACDQRISWKTFKFGHFVSSL